VQVFSLDAADCEELLGGIRGFAPDLIHAFHGYFGGRVARMTADATGIPYIVTLTGTDLYEAAEDGRRPEVEQVFRDASALVTFDRSMKRRLADRFPFTTEKIRVIHQGVEPPGEGCHGRGWLHRVDGGFAFFLPAGLRPVKNVLFPLPVLAELNRAGPRFSFILAGPVLDAEYAAKVLAELENHPFAHYVGAVGHDAMGCLYQQAEVVLNTSLFEGGMANSVLEALAVGKPVLAAAIDGNHALIKEGVTGLLYRDEGEFREKASRLLRDPELRLRLGGQGRRFVLENFTPDKEAAAYLELYRTVLA
jgi:glycosyltransferase involved in cell wall biosynthesis